VTLIAQPEGAWIYPHRIEARAAHLGGGEAIYPISLDGDLKGRCGCGSV
jgi:hypothetical protein